MTLSPKTKILSLAPLGALMALAMPPFGVWPLLFAGLGGFYAVVRTLKGRAAFIAGWMFGFGYYVAGLFWIGNALLVPGNDFKWVWPLAILGLPVGLALFTGCAAWVATRFSRLETLSGALFFTGILSLTEWIRGTIFTGFPWNLYGYGWSSVPQIMQSVAWAGTYGLTLMTVLLCVFTSFSLLEIKRRKKTAVTILSLSVISFLILFTWGHVQLQSQPTAYHDDIIVRVVQPSIQQEDKWRGDMVAQNLRTLVETTASKAFIADKKYVIVWPETAMTQHVAEDGNVRAYIRDTLFDSEDPRFLMSGVLRQSIDEATGKAQYYNSLIAYERDLVPMAIYDKAHLVPFGEYIPFQDFIPLDPFAGFSGFTPGPGLRTDFIFGLPPYSGLICYEVIFPGAVIPKSTSDRRAEWIINVTNDGWYGDSPGPYQHLTKARFRAIEEGVPLIRSANTGVSAIIDGHGRVLERIPYDVSGLIDSPLPTPLTSPPPYSRTGNLPFLIFCTIFIIVGVRRPIL